MQGPQANTGPSPPPRSGALDRALTLVEFLRANCAWDAAQTPASLLRHLVEETHEVVDAVVRGDDAALLDELGDLLLNLAFQVVLAEERGGPGREAIATQLEEKMRRRHPHLYGGGEPGSWDSLKAREREARGTAAETPLLQELPRGLDPLLRAQRMQELVARVGFDWPDAHGAWEKVREEVEEVRRELEQGDAAALEAEIGDLLFSAINLARRAGVFAPAALARANAKFVARWEELERRARQSDIALAALGLSELDRIWDEIKADEREERRNLSSRTG